MIGPLGLDEPGKYRIHVQGHLAPAWADWFSGLKMLTEYSNDGQPITTLTGMVTDQAELHGILMRIRDLGLPLLLVELAPKQTAEDGNETSEDTS